ncbi:putative atp-dependent zn protease protein [Botrytis fragariae]|uniref:Putative atp-dependent zn protease protein n=1 Tax=Botrytis fragariae TaxID=1964551 RepID=A0A8H6ENU4_9HELO|nr:putative atp-dependent zn protease protein [Botrytis fragariae]KAF5879048.1 putative atp-dependent zn protease protein [Botrytis fragariae]
MLLSPSEFLYFYYSQKAASHFVASQLIMFAGNHAEVFEGWKVQHGAQATSVPLTFIENLKKNYPDYHVMQTNPDKCDLMGYADAGFAKNERSDEIANCTVQTYHAPGSRLANKPKTVVEHVKFGRWAYVWEKMEYIVYQAQYDHPAGFGTLKLQFILTDKEEDPSAESINALILAASAWTVELHEEIYVFDSQEWVKDKNLYESVQGSSWDEVILNKRMKINLIADVEGFFDNQALYKKLAVPWKRGIILHGVPGNGKTISIKALMSTLSSRPSPIPSLYVKSFDGECHGPKWAISTIFQKARKMAPCLLIFEDLDSLVTEKTRSYFLNEVDGLESNDGILMIGSTNHLGKLDSSISKRPSRFDRKYCFRVPNEEERRAYVEFWRGKLGKDGGDMVEFGEELCSLVAKMTEGFSFAYLKELFIVTLLSIARSATEAHDDGAEDKDQGESYTTASTSTHTDDGVVVEKDDSMEDVLRDPQPSNDTEHTAEQTKPQKTLPSVDIPEHLTDNIFLKALMFQAKMLVEEMDNTDELMGGEKVPSPIGMGGAMPIGMARARAGMGMC